MGFFSKEECALCGKEIGALGKRKYDGGVICKDCDGLLSPFFYGRKRSTLDEIKRQLEMREANKQKVQQFVVTQQFDIDNKYLFVDTTHNWFSVGYHMNTDYNPDVFSFTDLVSCTVEQDQSETEDGIEYDYELTILTKVPYAPEIRLDLNDYGISATDFNEISRVQNLANQIVQLMNNQKAMGIQQPQGMGYNPSMPMQNNVGFAPMQNQMGGMPQMNLQHQTGVMNNPQQVQAGACPWCRAQVMPGTRFCPECGKPIT